jgi:hypothetical protein
MKAIFDNGRQNYSNVVLLKTNHVNAKPHLLGNISSGTLSVNSPSIFTYNVFDFTGRMVLKGALKDGLNTIPAAQLNKGMYIIQYQNSSEFYTEKFMRH